jgi:dUTP pyrophosphatase
MQLKIVLLHPDARVPTYAHPTDSGMDLYAIGDGDTTILPGRRRLIGTGIAIELPPNTEAQIRSRSGLALNFGIAVLNSPGTIDQDYRGEIKVLLVNQSPSPFVVKPGMKIAQMVIAPVLHPHTILSSAPLTSTIRGDSGFGSSGQ